MSERVVARGRIKVDARKALDKLRDHMLVDPHLWVCEIARVAVALGATRIDLDWSGDDLHVAFDGRALAPAAIAHARDHVLTPLDGPDGDALRALGIGIGAALSLDPAFVDVLQIEGESATRVRFERDYLDEGGIPVATAVAVPRTSATMRVHFRRRVGFDSIGRAIFDEAPVEARLLAQHFVANGVALFVRGVQTPRATPPPVLSVDLDVPGTTRAALDVLPIANGHPVVDYCEHGVRLASYVLSGCWGLAGMRGALPIRVVVDAPRLPTNASRSQVRQDVDVAMRVAARTTPAFAVAVAALRDPTTIAKTRFGHAVTVHDDEGALANAFGAIVAEAAHARRAGVDLAPEAVALLSVPILYDAMGAPLALADLRGGSVDQPIRIYEGTEALPADFAPWLAGAVWRRGLAAERALDGLELAPAREVIATANLARERRARALMHPASPPVVTASAATIHKETFQITEGPSAGLHGEIAVSWSEGGRPSTARLFVDERPLETVTLGGVPVPVDFALAWPGKIVARFEYDAVERNDALARALHEARRIAALAVVARMTDPPVLRAAIAMWGGATRALADDLEKVPRPVADASVWRTNDGRLVSLTAIAAYAKRTGAICYAKTDRSAPDGRIVLAQADLGALRTLLPERTLFVPYDRALDGARDLPEGRPPVALVVERGALSGWIAPGKGRLRVYHAGIAIRTERWSSRNGDVDIVLVDRDAIPQPTLDGAVWATPIGDLTGDEDALLEAVVDACERDAIPLETLLAYVESSRLRVSARGDDPALAARVADLPARRERARAAQRKAEVMARAPIDVTERIGQARRGSVVAPKRGAVVVTLATGRAPPTEVLFAGHPLTAMSVHRLPVVAFVDVVDEAFVADFTQLSAEGVAWAEGAILDASLALASELAAEDGFADDPASLELLDGLYVASPVRADLTFKTVRWPTVQGGRFQLGEAALARWGKHRYEPWHAAAEASPYDAPVLHLPASAVGDLRRRVFAAAGITLTDVSDAVARLQALRAKGAESAPPRLSGSPAHPLLRRTFAELGATWIEGEIELIDGDGDEITFVRADGVREPVALSFGCPVRAVYRAEVNAFAAVARELTLATEQLVRSVGDRLAALPPFVRDRYRMLVATELGRTGRIGAEDASREVFATTDGHWYSLKELQDRDPPVGYTTDPPPYPRDDADRIVRLGANEASCLERALRLKDRTQELRDIARGEARRAAPPRTEISLDAATRTLCMFTIGVNEEGIRGEIGLLHPTHADWRRLELFYTQRPLVTIADPDGWPVVAVLDDRALRPNVAFDGLASTRDDTARVYRFVRRIVAASVSRLLPAPSDTLGVIRLSALFVGRGVAALGVFWLPKEWPERPAVHVEGIGVVEKDRLPVVERGTVPVCGKVWLTADAATLPRALDEVMTWVSVRLAAHVRAAPMGESTDAYRWDLALLGVLDEPAVDPVKELASDRPDPALMRVAARRAPHLIDAATGDAPTAFVPAPEREEREVAEPADPEPSFFDGLVRKVVALVSRAPEPPADSPLTAAIESALTAMALTGDPVAVVRATRRGRPVVYDRARRSVLVNAEHPVVKALATRPDGVLHLVLAALSEINRELVEVTDAEEVAKVLDLLRANG